MLMSELLGPGGGTTMRTALVLAMLCTSCAARDVDAPDVEKATERRSALAGEAEADVDKLRARIDSSQLRLEPVEPVEPAAEFDEADALAALRRATGAEFRVEAGDGVWRASDGEYTATLETRSGRWNIEGGTGYDSRLSRQEDAAFLDQAAALLGGLASDVPRELDLKHLGGSTRVEGGPVQDESERLGSKVFALRKLGGLPVAGNRLVASYRNDGRLHAVRGLWPTIDVERSRLRSELSAEQVVDRALEQLVAHHVNPDRKEAIVLESFYELRPEGERWVAVLRAAALVTTYGHEGEPGRRERHDFDI
jgi:hypothetical protein